MKPMIIVLLTALLLAMGIQAEDDLGLPGIPVEAPSDPQPEGDWQVTRHQVEIEGEAIDYTATAGTIQLKNDKDEAKASVFFISYTRNGVEDLGKRPVMFCFNGGPGSSSVWLHMGCFGPRRVHMDEVGHAVGPPYSLRDNPLSLLDTTDLVFIDPVSTGFSRVEEGTNTSEYHSVSGDIRSVSEFIRLWITKFDRWLSPKYLAGESYGTTRAAGVANYLRSRSIDLNGIVLVSAVLSFQTLRFDEGNDLPYQLYVPTYTALARYHGKLDAWEDLELPELLDQAEAWSREVYGPALMQGAELDHARRREVAEQLSAYIGLPTELILQSDLRIPQWRFSDHLLAEQRQTVGRFDGRITGPDLDPIGERSGTSDPSYYRVAGGFTATFNDYVRNELGYETEKNYGILVGLNWNYDRVRASYLNVAGDLRRAMAENPELRVYVAAGYYDLATPYHAAEYTFNHSITHPDARERVTFGYFESGHMVFTHQDSLVKLRGELVEFFE
ncbi:MAG: peptidase S10 [Planctomycetota bacterium]